MQRSSRGDRRPVIMRARRWMPAAAAAVLVSAAGAGAVPVPESAATPGAAPPPSGAATTPAPGAGTTPAPGAGTTPAPGAATTPAPTAATTTTLRLGARGASVRDLQRQLRRRGARIVADGVFGPATRRAVQRVQRRLGLRATGVADPRLLRRLGVRVRTIAGGGPAVAPVAGRYVSVFPVAGDHAYSDDWGAARPQGGHEGTDILADRNVPIVAASDAQVERINREESGRGGVYLWLLRSDGIRFYYAHMQSIADGLALGSRVTAGQVVGSVGNSGDARFGPTHLHIEVRRGWTPFNPYPELVGVDPDQARSG